MKNILFSTLSVAVLTIATLSTANAATVVESFGGLTGTFDGATLPAGFTGGGTINAVFNGLDAGSFGGTALTLVDDEANDFVGAADSKFLTWAGDSDRYALLESAGIPETAGKLYTAFAFKVNTVSATAADNDIEVFRLGQGAGFRDISISIIDGALTLSNRNGIAAAVVLQASVPAGDWRVIAVEADFVTASATSSVKVSEISPTGVITTLGTASAFTATRNSGVTDYGFGAFAVVPTGTAAINIGLDEVRIYSNVDVTSSADFIQTVGFDYYGLANADVQDWNLY